MEREDRKELIVTILVILGIVASISAVAFLV
jgi:hypothetical protein